MNRKLLLFSVLALPVWAAALEPGPYADAVNAENWTPIALGGGRFFFSLAAGILLAFAFQWVLASLSLATGISALGGKRGGISRRNHHEEMQSRDADDMESPILKIETEMGIWALVTGCISLFAATWLATELLRFGTRNEAVILGLTIWAGFMITMMSIDTAALGSLLGAVIGAFKQGHSLVGAPLKTEAAAGSRDDRAKLDAKAIAAKVRDEFRSQGGGRGLKDKLHGYLEKMDIRGQDRFVIESEANGLFEDEEIREMARRGELLRVDRNRFREMIVSRGDISAEESAQWADALYIRWNGLREENKIERPAGAAGTLIGEAAESGTEERVLSRMEGETSIPGPDKTSETAKGEPAASGPATALAPGGFKERLQGFKEFLRTSDRRELNPVRLEQEVEILVVHPEEGYENNEKDARSVRRDEVVKVLRTRRDISSQEADSIADLVDSARTRMLSRSEMREHRMQESTDKAIARLRDLIYGLKRPERDYEGFREDIARLVEDAEGGADELKTDPQGLDRDSLFKMFFSKPGISKRDAERMAETADPVLRDARERTERIEAETLRRIEEARIATRAKAEGARTAAATAAWWLFGISLATGAAAAFGGWISTTTRM